MTTMTDGEWRSFVTAGARLAHPAAEFAESFVQRGCTAVRTGIGKVVTRSGLG